MLLLEILKWSFREAGWRPCSQDHIAIDYHKAGEERIAAQLWHTGRHGQTIVFLNDLIVSGHHSTDENVETESTGASRSECRWGRVELHTAFQGQCGWVSPCYGECYGHS
jgi:hypothetical protein